MCASPSRSRRIANSLPARGVTQAAIVACLAVSVVAEAGTAGAGEQTYRIDPEFTSAEFAVSHLGLSKQRGHFARTRGTIVLDPESHGGRIELVIDATSVETGWPARDEFLKGEDMFDAARFPLVSFRSTHLTFDDSRLVSVAGELTMHNVTHAVVLKVGRLDCGRTPDDREGCGADVATTIKRSEFGMSYALGLIGDEIDLSFQVTAFRIPAGSGDERR
jgi:polyisoprenoid-binding protein YceI